MDVAVSGWWIIGKAMLCVGVISPMGRVVLDEQFCTCGPKLVLLMADVKGCGMELGKFGDQLV